jgi:hypothetical protein
VYRMRATPGSNRLTKILFDPREVSC